MTENRLSELLEVSRTPIREALLLLSHDTGARMTEIDLKVAETTAGLVGRQMEQ